MIKEILPTATVITLAQIYTIMAAMTQVAVVVTVVDMAAAVIAIVVVMMAVVVVIPETNY
ncbi:MAG: hypothetical protein NWQ28_11125 [Nodularia sp. (in: cyanobacteria)]|nr:hypothetical protein [Nodularia sp. (in: cyanobacteria)]